MNRKKPEEDRSRIRCAIYTRKSTEERLDLEFNSLDAQRDAAESFIASQKSEGWVCLPKRYDDGGFSGGNLDRPAYNELMKDNAGLSLAQLCGTLSISDIYPQRNSTVKLLY